MAQLLCSKKDLGGAFKICANIYMWAVNESAMPLTNLVKGNWRASVSVGEQCEQTDHHLAKIFLYLCHKEEIRSIMGGWGAPTYTCPAAFLHFFL